MSAVLGPRDAYLRRVEDEYPEVAIVARGDEVMVSGDDAAQVGAVGRLFEELATIVDIARATGIVLDPVYSGKAAIGLVADLKARPVKRALFIHTGGLLGLYSKQEQLAPLLKGGWCSYSAPGD